MIGPLKVIGPFAKTIITPYGAALLILLMSLRSGQTTILLGIIGIAGLVLVLDLVAMLTADRILTTPACVRRGGFSAAFCRYSRSR